MIDCTEEITNSRRSCWLEEKRITKKRKKSPDESSNESANLTSYCSSSESPTMNSFTNEEEPLSKKIKTVDGHDVEPSENSLQLREYKMTFLYILQVGMPNFSELIVTPNGGRVLHFNISTNNFQHGQVVERVH